jgi:hypothetical protein
MEKTLAILARVDQFEKTSRHKVSPAERIRENGVAGIFL